MARISVVYFSETGNTEKVARAIQGAVVAAGHECDITPVQAVRAEDLVGFDLVFLGSACHSTTVARPVAELLGRIPVGSGLALAGFATFSAPTAGDSGRAERLHTEWAGGCRAAFEAASADRRVELMGYFGCQGKPSPPIEEFIHRTVLPDDGEWQPYIEEARRHPTPGDLEAAGEFAREVLSAYGGRASFCT